MTIIDFSEEGRGRLVRGLLTLAACLIGLALPLSGFKSPLWTVAVALLVGLGADCLVVALGLVMLDRFSEQRRRAQWNLVRESATATIQFSLWFIAWNAVSLLGVDDKNLRELLDDRSPQLNVGRALKELSAMLPKRREDGSVDLASAKPGISIDRDQLMGFVTASLPRCRHVHNTLLLGVVASANPSLIDALHKFQRALDQIEAIEQESSSRKIPPELTTNLLASWVGTLLARGSELSVISMDEFRENQEKSQ